MEGIALILSEVILAEEMMSDVDSLRDLFFSYYIYIYIYILIGGPNLFY